MQVEKEEPGGKGLTGLKEAGGGEGGSRGGSAPTQRPEMTEEPLTAEGTNGRPGSSTDSSKEPYSS